MIPSYRSTGNAKPWAFHSGSKAQSSLGGAFENARIIARIGLVPALWMFAFFAIFAVLIAVLSPAASPARPDAQQPDAFEARAGGKVLR